MELDDLKQAWASLDNRLKKNEELKESIILEMMGGKARKLVNRFVFIEMFSVVALIVVLPFIIFMLDKMGGRNWAADTAVFIAMAVCIVYPFWGVYKIHGLMKFDLSKNVCNNIYYVNSYRIQLNREKKVVYYFLVPVLVMLGVVSYAIANAKFTLWALFISMLIAVGLITYWSYKLYNKNIDSILKSLDEIKELKEE